MCRVSGLLAVVRVVWGRTVVEQVSAVQTEKVMQSVALTIAHLAWMWTEQKVRAMMVQARQQRWVLLVRAWVSHSVQMRVVRWCCYSVHLDCAVCHSFLHHVVGLAGPSSKTQDGKVRAGLVLHHARMVCRFSFSFLRRAPSSSQLLHNNSSIHRKCGFYATSMRASKLRHSIATDS